MKIDYALITIISLLLFLTGQGQTIVIEDDFESSETSLNWEGIEVTTQVGVSNPFQTDQNISEGVLSYSDYGALYGHVRLDVPINFDLTENSTFTVSIYLPSDELTGDQENQISLKLQNSNLNEPWTTQSEIIRPLQTDEWQTVSFDFSTDDYINLNSSSPAPTERFDFDRIVLQVNGENNTDQVTAYLDDFAFNGVLDPDANPTTSPYTALVWSDEFEIDGPVNEDKWFHQTILPNGFSWFNNEVQHYTDREDNSYVEDGHLHIVAKNETYFDQGITKDYTSARLNSKFAFTYGRVVAKAKLPFGPGTWPAIWTLGKNIIENGGYWADEFGTTFWPACGEIDIMEHWGNNQNVISAALHTPSSYGATENYGTIYDDDVSEEFHLYEMIWTPDEINFSIDGLVYYTYSPAQQNADTWPYTADQYLLLNVAIQENVSPAFDEEEMVLDYIRVYQEGNPLTTLDQSQESLKVYPNPAKDVLFVEVPSNDESGQLEIHSITGVKLRSIKSSGSRMDINLSGLAKGAYVATFRNENLYLTHPFVKL